MNEKPSGNFKTHMGDDRKSGIELLDWEEKLISYMSCRRNVQTRIRPAVNRILRYN